MSHFCLAFLSGLLLQTTAFRYEAYLEAEPIFPTFSTDSLLRLERQEAEETHHNESIQCTSSEQLELGDFGTITSPNYPWNYPSALNCEWILQGPPGSRIEATFFDIYTQPWFFAYFDYILVSRSGDFNDSERFFGDLNTKTPMTVLSTRNQLGVRFRSSTYFNFRGFKLQYLVVPEVRSPHFGEPIHLDGICGRSFILNTEVSTTTKTITETITAATSIPSADVTSSTKATRRNSNSKYFDRVFGNVAGGAPAQPFSYPWMAALLIDGKSFCGGSLIDESHILTAAHCTDGAKKISVLLGSHNLKSPKTDEPSRKVINVTSESFFPHPEYNKKTVSHDIALIRLPNPINFTREIHPICLPNKYFLADTFENAQVRVAGWGKVKDLTGSISTILQHVGVAVLPNSECRMTFQGVVTGNNMCVDTKPRQSPCKGDSGGPMMMVQSGPQGDFFMQVGIVSFGTSSCDRGLPVGFTRITAFLDYIAKITRRNI